MMPQHGNSNMVKTTNIRATDKFFTYTQVGNLHAGRDNNSDTNLMHRILSYGVWTDFLYTASFLANLST